MTRSKIYSIVIVVLIGLFVYRLRYQNPQEQALAANYLPEVRKLLNERLVERDDACVYEGPFPFDSRNYEPQPYRASCNRCEDLYLAGLLTKRVYEAERFHATVLSVRFELTEFGQSFYNPGLENPKKPHPRFCFGATTLNDIKSVRTEIDSSGGPPLLLIHYVVKVEKTHPFLLDPRSKPLRLVSTAKEIPEHYETRNAVFRMYPKRLELMR